MKPFKILIPNLICETNYFETFDEAETTAKLILKSSNFRFVSLFQNDVLLTIFIKNGYELYNFKAFCYLDEIGKISDYFILNTEGVNNYYIKIKK